MLYKSAYEPRKQWRAWLIGFGLIALLQLTIIPNMNPYYLTIIMYAGINMILASSLNLVNGFTGQFSIGHAGFMSTGAYTASFLSLWLNEHASYLLQGPLAHLTFFVLLIAAGLVACVIGYLVGLPSLRLKGDYLAIVTLGMGEIVRVVLLNMNAVGGARGLPAIPALSNFFWVYGTLLVTLFVIWRLIQSARGRAFLCVASDEVAAQAVGINTTRTKVRAFVLSSFFAGVAGALFAHYLRFINPQSFDFNRSFEIVIMVVLGGMGSLTGSVAAAFLLTALKEALRPLQEITHLDFRMVIYSLMLIVLMLTKPHGLFGTREWMTFLPKKWKERWIPS